MTCYTLIARLVAITIEYGILRNNDKWLGNNWEYCVYLPSYIMKNALQIRKGKNVECEEEGNRSGFRTDNESKKWVLFCGSTRH